MKYTLLVTCGTSILNNAARDANSKSKPESLSDQTYNRLVEINKEYDLARLARLDPGSIEDREIRDNHTHSGSRIYQTLIDYIKERGGKDASAEINTIELLIYEHKMLASDIDNIFLYHSDTGSGMLCAKIMEEYLRSKGLNSQRIEITGFSSAKTLDQFQEGMMRLMSKVVEMVKRRKRGEYKDGSGKVYVLATAGFKPESTAAVIAALLAGADGIYYVYEGTRELVMIPPIPLALDERVTRYIDSIFGSDYRKDKPIDAILEHGIDNSIIDMLEERGLIERKGDLANKIRLRGWVVELLG
ncbi:MAG: putative CRISPR-associated protein [Candidatus Nitrosocaldus sp.]